MPEVLPHKHEKKIHVTPEVATHTHTHEHPVQHYGPLSSYCHYPQGVKFVGTDEHEHIILLLRKHWLTNVRWIATAILLLIVPLPFVYFPILNFMPERFLVITILFWYLVTSAYSLEKFLSWFFNVYIVTDERVFDVDFYNLVDRDITDANIKDIQDVTSAMRGALRTAFDYGDIRIQTSAEVPEIEFESVPHPDRVAKILRGLRVEEEQEELEGRVR